jgi:DNA-binding response OmpR family regulator
VLRQPAGAGRLRRARLVLRAHTARIIEMHRILIVTTDRDSLSPFAASLEESHEVRVAWAATGEEAIADVRKNAPLGVIIDENLLDMPGLDLVRRILPINALIHPVVISDLPPDAFHEASEGLGILAQLAPKPSPSDARTVLARLRKMSSLALDRPRT